MKYIFNQKILTTELVMLFVSNLLLLNLPLTNILGYEYSVINGILITFFSGVFTVSFIRKNGLKKGMPEFFRELFRDLSLLLILPLLMGLIAAFFVKNCSLMQGLFYYLVLTVPSVIIGSSLGLIGYLISSKFSYLNFIVLYLIILLLPLFYFYFNPQVYFYNPVIGYYPGTIYDEAVQIDLKLISYRLLNLLYFGCLGYFAFKLSSKKSFRLKAVLYLAGLLAAVIFILSGDSLEYATTEKGMIKKLGGHISTGHFEVYYDSRIESRSVKSVLLHNEYYFEQICSALKVKPSKKVTTFLFYDSQQKKELMGSANADVAKPWLYQLYINYSNYEQTLKHEIVHCVSSEFGVTPFKISSGFNPSMLEGLAVALQDDYNGHTVHYMAALAYNNGYKYPVDKLFEGLNFFGQLSSLSYIYAGSFIKFLIDKYGVEKLKKVYSHGSFSSAYGKPLNELVNEYYGFIAVYGKPSGSDEAVYYYGRKPIFKRVCARYLAERIENAWALYNSGQYGESEEMFRNLLKYSESYQALIGYVNSLRKTEKAEQALKVLKYNLDKYANTSYYYNLELITADMLALNKDFNKADSVYLKLSGQNASRDYDYLSSLRRQLAADTSVLRRYLKGSDFDKYSILKVMNAGSVSYASVPVLIGLSEKLEENYEEFMKNWTERIKVTDFQSSYAAYKLSDYALRHLKFEDARRLIIDALSYKDDSEYREVLTNELRKINWFINFSEVTPAEAKQRN